MIKQPALPDIILGGQDGLVNTLGVILGVAAASRDARLVIAAGLAATFAESISMGAVALTSKMAERDFQIAAKDLPYETSTDIYRRSAVVGLAALIGALIPLTPYFFLSPTAALWPTVILSAIALYLTGAYKARLTLGHPVRSGLQLLLIGLGAAFAGYGIGLIFGVR